MRFLRSLALVSATTLVVAALDARPAAAAPELVAFGGNAARGTIVVRTSERRLYFVLGQGRALRYMVGVGRAGWQWAGTSAIEGKFIRPNWEPPAVIRRELPALPALIPGGSPANPMGAAAMTLAGGAYAIHGTNTPRLIGGFVSHGCIRMYNEDIVDLYGRVSIGTPVVVTQ
ncbi:MAG: L,D-transpeptidase [Devosia sp.]|nr:L,D-transpeptidase [Devosia sp.]